MRMRISFSFCLTFLIIVSNPMIAQAQGREPGPSAEPQQPGPQPEPQQAQPQPLSPVRIAFRGREAAVPPGTKLRTALLLSGLTPHSEGAVYINCRGLGSCGTCAVEVSGAVQPAEWTTAERLRLNFPPHSAPGNRRVRLACQVGRKRWRGARVQALRVVTSRGV
ncbi:hypothetical protein TSOC_004823 [Tetrabaena socialis]|uniref:2Fe-2S ferredoxin-type domain-containing protein n=1 Tax=Tetrabaena socialis TaxID=47790 RepID=A0A2J8A7X1_9CHLO|nr:hypothetical protein TSOC_004823 [Tetrabaena socialis]|eukprot:PNH08626.1 hypothetical protein TSOC_004823 [Tetrabaena socialis]